MFYWFTFADGYRECTRGYSHTELHHMTTKHGKLVSKERA